MTWQYFYVTNGAATDDAAPAALGRTDKSGRQHNAQMLGRGGTWMASEFLMRYHMLGSNEDDYVLITEQRAIEIIGAWMSSGRLPHAPDEP